MKHSALRSEINKQKILDAVSKAIDECAKQHEYNDSDLLNTNPRSYSYDFNPYQVKILVDFHFPFPKQEDGRIYAWPIVELNQNPNDMPESRQSFIDTFHQEEKSLLINGLSRTILGEYKIACQEYELTRKEQCELRNKVVVELSNIMGQS
jgi:hypothetical protein